MPEQSRCELSIYIVEQASLEDLRVALGDERLTWAYASRMEDTGLGWLHDLINEKPLGAPLDGVRPGVPLKRWAEGRAFGPQLEVDWWCDDGTYRLRTLIEEGVPPQDVDWGEPVNVNAPLRTTGGDRPILLHGELDEDRSASGEHLTWSEARIPRYLAHPYEIQAGMEQPKRVTLVVRDYARNGTIVLTRLLKVTSPQD